MSDPNQHAPFAPSGLSRVVACPGSYNLINAARAAGLALDEDDTPKSMEGTAAHWVLTEVVADRWPAEGSLAPNGIAITDEMLEGAEVWLQAVGPYLEGAQIEQRVECPTVHPKCWGTPDLSSVVPGIVRVPDYKFGHRYVDAFENWQLVAYAAGLRPEYLPTVRFELTIVQPRSYHRDGPIRTWVLNGEEMRGYVQRLSIACHKAEQPDAQCIVTPECYECPGRHVCEAAQRAELAAFELAGSTVPLELSSEAKSLRLRQIRRALDHLKQMEGGVSEDIEAMIKRGQSVPGFSLEASAGREKWTAPMADVSAMGAAMGVKVDKPGLITPAQARNAGLDPDIVAAFSERQSGKIELVESGDKLRRVFG